MCTQIALISSPFRLSKLQSSHHTQSSSTHYHPTCIDEVGLERDIEQGVTEERQLQLTMGQRPLGAGLGRAAAATSDPQGDTVHTRSQTGAVPKSEGGKDTQRNMGAGA